ncbi:hypothetical protein [Priestia aryabhattai]
MMMGEVSPQNRLYSGGIVLSTGGAKKLYEQIKK